VHADNSRNKAKLIENKVSWRLTYFFLRLDISYAVVGGLQLGLELFGKGGKYVWINL